MAAPGGGSSSSIAASGQLSEDRFQASVALFCQWWQETFPDHPPWQMQHVIMPVTEQVVQYAQLERLVRVSSNPLQPQQTQPTLTDSNEADGQAQGTPYIAEHDDPAEAGAAAQQHQQWRQQQCHVHMYSVVWHEIYRVPVLYLAACRQDGCPLTLPELCIDLPQLQEYQDMGQASWTYITATAHPATGGPCYMLHPCQTAARMQLLMQCHTVQGTSSSAGSRLTLTGAAASTAPEAAAGSPAPCAGAALAGIDMPMSPEASELLAYARGWFSMVAPLLGLSMLHM